LTKDKTAKIGDLGEARELIDVNQEHHGAEERKVDPDLNESAP
jgi:serine/threonine protein kinase